MAILWGPIGDVGMFAREFKNIDAIFGAKPQSITSCLNSLEAFLKSQTNVATSVVWAEKHTGVQQSSEDEVLKSIARVLGNLY